jgi:hypothetical protein
MWHNLFRLLTLLFTHSRLESSGPSCAGDPSPCGEFAGNERDPL